jgi:ADP-ribose pyrophosphatase YjhB (NUDIX family)
VRGEKRIDESIHDAALREVNHETGLNITKITPINFNYSYSYLKNLNNINAEVSCFVARADDDLVTLSTEHNYYKWVDYENALMFLEFEEQKKFLEFINKQIKL